MSSNGHVPLGPKDKFYKILVGLVILSGKGVGQLGKQKKKINIARIRMLRCRCEITRKIKIQQNQYWLAPILILIVD